MDLHSEKLVVQTSEYWTWRTWKIFLTQAGLVVLMLFGAAAYFGPASDRRKLEEIDKVVDKRLKELKFQESLHDAAMERERIEANIERLSGLAERSIDTSMKLKTENERIKATLNKVIEEAK